jgi:hypothetical protein
MECQCLTTEQDGTQSCATETECPMAVSTTPLTEHPHLPNLDEEVDVPTADPNGTKPEPSS